MAQSSSSAFRMAMISDVCSPIGNARFIVNYRDMRNLLLCCLFTLLLAITGNAKPVHHYVFFGMDREKLKDATAFLETKNFEGAQIAYSWRQLEPGKDEYDFSLIREDLAFLSARGKKLFVQIQDVSFSEKWIHVPRYLLKDPQYGGGADKQYRYKFVDQ